MQGPFTLDINVSPNDLYISVRRGQSDMYAWYSSGLVSAQKTCLLASSCLEYLLIERASMLIVHVEYLLTEPAPTFRKELSRNCCSI